MPRKKKEQKRFKAAFEIEGEINRLNKKQLERMKFAERMELAALILVRESNDSTLSPGEREYRIECADREREKGRKSRRTAEIIDEEKLPQLKRTLAAFKTQTLFPNDDKAVVLSK